LKEDKLLLAGVIGGLSTIPAEIVSRILLFLGIGKYTIYQLDSFIFTMNRPTIIIGIIVCLIVGGFSAVLLYSAFKRLGSDNLVIKSAMFGLLLCMLQQILFTITVEGKYIEIRPISDYYVHMLGAATFGITEGLLFKKFLLKKTFQ